MDKLISRLLPVCFLLCCMSCHAASAERIVFKYENTADLRGLVNVLTAFRAACLSEPLAPALPAELLPNGYQIVSGPVYMWGKEDGSLPNNVVLSKTGNEESDAAGGYPTIKFILPTARVPEGACEVSWARRWVQDYPSGPGRLSHDMAASLVARVSYHLGAALLSPPDAISADATSYSDLTTWRTECRATKLCRFDVLARIDQEGIEVTVTWRDEIQ
jgi:hypothetical protein